MNCETSLRVLELKDFNYDLTESFKIQAEEKPINVMFNNKCWKNIEFWQEWGFRFYNEKISYWNTVSEKSTNIADADEVPSRSDCVKGSIVNDRREFIFLFRC